MTEQDSAQTKEPDLSHAQATGQRSAAPLEGRQVSRFLHDAIESYQPTSPDHISMVEQMSKVELSGDTELVLHMKDGGLVRLNWTITRATMPARSANG
jgi:hypothetical protein